MRVLHTESGLVILNGADEFYRTAPLWKVTDHDGQQWLVREWTAWAAEEEADELLELV